MIDIFGFVINEKIIYAFITLVIGYILYRFILGIVNKSFEIRMKRFKIDVRKQKTINILINNIIKYVFVVITIFTLLGIIGVNVGAIIASIGIIGLAVGLAVQDILRDVLGGIFILVENQYAIGDTVMIGGFKGEVIFLGLKSTKIRSETGEIKILSNRNISDITNYSLQNAISYIDINLNYDNEEEVVEKALTTLASQLSKKMDHLKGDIKYVGIKNVSDKITYRLVMETDIRYQDECKSKLWSELKKTLDKNGIR